MSRDAGEFGQQLEKMKKDCGFIAALDQSGGSTPGALRTYGIEPNAWSNDDEMFALVHKMRARVIESPAFTGDRLLGAILFENTMDRKIGGRPTAHYLWNVKRIVPLLKVDKGLAPETRGVQLMKPMPGLAALLDKARTKRIGRARELIERLRPGCDLEVDGGIDANTAPLVVRAGANVLVAGSAIFGDRDGVAAAMKRLQAAARS